MSARYCHTDEQVGVQIAALRPRGDAWRHGGHDGLEGSVQGRVFAAFGAMFGLTERRFCALIDEFFCSSAVETRDLWALDHGLPDGCDPFADICEKVNAVGDSTPTYAVAAALRRGWVISIEQDFVTSVEDCAMGCGLVGTLIMGAEQGVAWRIAIDLAASPAYTIPAETGPIMGLMLMADVFDCDTDFEGLICLIRRIAPAHADLIFTSF